MIDRKQIITIIICAIVALGVIKACEQEPKIVVKTETKTVIKHDTIHNFEIVEKPTKVFIERFKTLKGKDSIVYVKEPNSSTIDANSFKTVISSNKAEANLNIVTTGELLDVTGVITYPEVTNTVTITKVKAQSGLFIYGSVPINANAISPELGVMYQFKNSFLLKSGVQYNSITNSPEINIGVGVKIF